MINQRRSSKTDLTAALTDTPSNISLKTLMIDIKSPPVSPTQEQTKLFLTSFGTIQHKGAINTATDLADQSFTYAITGTNPTAHHNDDPDPFAYTTTNRYTSDEFYGVMIDTGASKRSTAGYRQYLAYKKTYNTVINTLEAGASNVQFGISFIPSINSITVNTPIGNIKFHIIKADTPFLLCLTNIDTLKVYYNNFKNVLVTPTKSVPIVHQFSHPFLL